MDEKFVRSSNRIPMALNEILENNGIQKVRLKLVSKPNESMRSIVPTRPKKRINAKAISTLAMLISLSISN